MSIINRFVKSELHTSLFRGAAITLGFQLSGIAVTYTMQVLLALWMGVTQ